MDVAMNPPDPKRSVLKVSKPFDLIASNSWP
jgi:hypothetical protein